MAKNNINDVHYLTLSKHFTRLGNPSYDVIVVYKMGGSNMYYKQFQFRCYDHEIPECIRAKMELSKAVKIRKIY